MNAQELIYTLNLEDYPNTYIQRLITGAIPTFIITYNSRYPYKMISFRKLKTTPVSTIYRASQKAVSKFKLTPPILISNFTGLIPLNAVIFVRDIGGEGFLVPRDINPSPPEEEPGFISKAIDYIKTVI